MGGGLVGVQNLTVRQRFRRTLPIVLKRVLDDGVGLYFENDAQWDEDQAWRAWDRVRMERASKKVHRHVVMNQEEQF